MLQFIENMTKQDWFFLLFVIFLGITALLNHRFSPVDGIPKIKEDEADN